VSGINGIDKDQKKNISDLNTRSLRTKLESMGFITVSLDDYKNDSAIKYNESVTSVEKTVQDIKRKKADYEILSKFYSTSDNKNITVNVQLKDVDSGDSAKDPQINQDAIDLDQAQRAFTHMIEIMFYGDNYEKSDITKKVLFKTSPKGGKVVVDGKTLSTNKAHSIKVGPHDVVFTLLGYANIIETIDVMPDDKEPIEIKRSFNTPKAYILWNEIPTDSKVFVDDVKVENPVGRYIVEASKRHEVKVKKKGYDDYVENFDFVEGEEKPISITNLIPIKGTLIVYAPTGSHIYIDDEPRGMIDDVSKPLEVKDLDVETDLKINVKKSKYKTQKDNLRFMPGEKITKKYELLYVQYDEDYLRDLRNSKIYKMTGFATSLLSATMLTLSLASYIEARSTKSEYDKSTNPSEIVALREKHGALTRNAYIYLGFGSATAIASIILLVKGITPLPPEEQAVTYSVTPGSESILFTTTFKF